jgi:RNA polymerase sigma-70 factor (sigma-E family)
VDGEARRRLREFVVARTPALMRVAYLLTGNQHDAEDLVQTALTKAAARWESIRHEDPEAYVRRVMYHAQVSWWRRRARRREQPVHPLPEVDHTADPGPGADLRLAVRQVLSRLTPRQRAVLVLRYFEDLPEKQVAEVLGCSVGTVRSQVHRALARFRALAPELVSSGTAGSSVPRWGDG